MDDKNATMNPIKSEPILIEVPGIPGKLRSQSLDEYVGALVPEHPARAELAQIRALALEGMKSAHDLMLALQRIKELEAALNGTPVSTNLVPPPTPMVFDPPDSPPTVFGPPLPPAPKPKAKCPECGRMVSTVPGPWAAHQKTKHNKTGVKIPQVD